MPSENDLRNTSPLRAVALNSPEAVAGEDANDVALWRLNDVEIAKIASDIGEMDMKVFDVIPVTQEHSKNARGYIHFLAASLSTMCVDISAVGKYEAIALSGMTHYVNVGRAKVAVQSGQVAKDLHREFQKLWRQTITPYRKEITDEILRCLDDPEYAAGEDGQHMWYVTTGSNASILVRNESTARALEQQLTRAFREAIQDTRETLCTRLKNLLVI